MGKRKKSKLNPIEFFEFSLKSIRKHVCVHAVFSSHKVTVLDGYFMRNEKHRLRNTGNKMDVNECYYKARTKLLEEGYLAEDEIVINNSHFYNKFLDMDVTAKCIPVYKIVKPIEFKSVVYAKSVILGNWTSEGYIKRNWRPKTL